MKLANDMPANEGWVFEKVAARKRSYGNEICVERVRDAARTIAGYVKQTPTFREDVLSDRFGTNVYLKYEVMQHTGAFKVRGAFNKLLSLTPDQRQKGVVAVSGGNHAQAVAFAGRELGIRVLTLMPDFTPENYVRRTAGYGATIEMLPSLSEAFAAAEGYVQDGMTLVHPFDDPDVICGQGTIAFEVLRDVPKVTDIVLSIGGGGLAAGVATVVKSLRPEVKIWGVETEGAESMSKALAAGGPFDIVEMTSIARTLGATKVGEHTFKIVKERLAEVLVVSDDEAVDELFWLLDRVKVITEPAASCTVAAMERLRAKFGPDSHVVIILCGGNAAIDEMVKFRDRTLTPPLLGFHLVAG